MRPVLFSRNPLGSSITPPLTRQASTNQRSLLTPMLTLSSLLALSIFALPDAHAQTANRTFAGTVTLDGWLGNSPAAPEGNLTFTLADKNSPRFLVKTVPYPNNGAFSFSVPPGNYAVTVEGNRTVRTAATADLTLGDLTNFSLTLPNGDVDGNGLINVDDVSLLLNLFNTTSSDDSYNATADLNGDGFINVDDLSLLLYNFNVSSVPALTAAQSWHLANVSLSQTGVVGSATLTGTVTLASSATVPVDVTLRSSLDYYATFSSLPVLNMTTQVVTIPAGQLSTSFTVYVTDTYSENVDGSPTDYPLTDTATATISASAYGWTQSAQVTVAAQGTDTSAQNLNLIAFPGNGCVLVDWKKLPKGTIKGYRLYKNGIALNPATSPLTDASYMDASVSNETSYQYEVSVIGLNGTEGARSSAVTTVPSSSLATVSWNNLPSNFSSATYLSVLLNPDAPEIDQAMFFIDGQFAGCAGVPRQVDSALNSLNLTGSIQTGNLTNGQHTLQFIGIDVNGNLQVSPIVTLSSTNDAVANQLSELVTSYDNSVANYEFQLPLDTTDWTATLTNKQGNLLGQWQGSGTIANFAFNGRDGAEQPLPDGDYKFQVASYATGRQKTSTSASVKVLSRPPTALALIAYTYENTVNYEKSAGFSIGDDFDTIQGSSPSFKGLVWYEGSEFEKEDNISLPPASVTEKMKQWIGNTLDIFYINSHGYFVFKKGGVMDYTMWRGLEIYPTLPTNNNYLKNYILNHPDRYIVIDRVNTSHRTYKFVYLDCCHSAGGAASDIYNPTTKKFTGEDRIGTPDAKWARAFGISPDVARGAFIGWDGSAEAFGFGNLGTNKWYAFTTNLWQRLAFGEPFYNAIPNATTYAQVPGRGYATSIYPWDVLSTAPHYTRLQFFGDNRSQIN